MAMLCAKPDCGGGTVVVDSRRVDKNEIRRRRECVRCSFRFTTKEAKLEAKADVILTVEARVVELLKLAKELKIAVESKGE